MNKKTLIISPHVDDELLGCFSFLNEDAHVIECGVDLFHVVTREERLEELKNLSEHCGFTYDVFLDNKVNNYVMQNLIPIFEEQINKVKPDKVFIPLYDKIRSLQDPYPNAFIRCKDDTILYLTHARYE